MTTIAVCREMIAADSQVGGEHTYQQWYKKIRKLPSGIIVATAGEVFAGEHFVEWIKSGGDRDDLPDYDLDEAHSIVIYPNGHMYEYIGIERMRVKPPFAVGSGAAYALGVLVHGASARDAVAAAKKLDPDTGGPIKVVRLK